MATITLTIPDAQVSRVITALCARPFFAVPIADPVDPPTPAAAKQIVVDWIKLNVRAYEQIQIQLANPVPDTDGLIT